MYGAHLSIAGGPSNALAAASRLGADCLQVFTKNQRQWRVPPLSDEQIRAWQEARARLAPGPVVSHASYLINLASPDPDAWARSIGLFRVELERCAALGIPELVIHPGAHKGAGEEAGLARIAAALDRVHHELPGLGVRTSLEITAGQGTTLGASLGQLRHLLESAGDPERLSICLDTAHLHGAGYDLSSAAGAEALLDAVEESLGKARVAVWHINDTPVDAGAHRDRHAHIGHGRIAGEAIEAIAASPPFPDTPKILETPKGTAPDGRSWDAVNLAALRRLSGRA